MPPRTHSRNCQRRFIYHPSRASRQSLDGFAKAHGFEAWENGSGQFIGWKQLSVVKPARRTILIVHGNAGSAIDRLGYADGIRSLEPVDVYILEYPGYGPREGSPSEQSLFRAASEALKLLGTNAPVCVLGESLGTGVASYLAGAYPTKVKGIVLIAPYNNLTEVARHHMPIFPVKWLLRDRFPSARHLNGFRGPVAVLLAGRDLVVPEPLGRKLYESYRGPKRLWEFPQAGHEDLVEQPESWWRELLAFWDSSG